LHEPHVKCFTKGKEHKKYEFGSKASFLITQNTGVIVGAMNFNNNIHDSKTLPSAIEQYERLTERKAKNIFVDRGYRGPKMINQTAICVPKIDKNITNKKRKQHSRRAAIEPIIGHLKHNYRMIRNYLKGVIGDEINVIMAAAAMNFKRVMNLWRTEANFCWKLICYFWQFVYQIFFAQKLQMTF
jgi:IS5 family transposase